MPEVYGPRTEYLRQIGFPQGPQNMAQRYLEQMYQPYRNLWETQQLMGGALGQAGPEWSPFVAQQNVPGAGLGGLYGGARTSLANLLGLSTAARAEAGLNFEPTFDPVTGARLQTAEGTLGQGNLQDLLRYGQAGRMGGMGAQWFAGRLPQMEQNWLGGQAGGTNVGESFLDYLKRRYGL